MKKLMSIFPEINKTFLTLIDVQEKFVPAIKSFSQIVAKQQLMLQSANEIGLQTVVTEQYPQGLGSTVSELRDLFQKEWPVIEKNSFSCLGAVEFRDLLDHKNINCLVLMGIETHVCVQQTAFDALEQGYSVFLLADTVASRHEYDRETALALMREKGVNITTAEAFLFMLLRSSTHQSFRGISKLIRNL